MAPVTHIAASAAHLAFNRIRAAAREPVDVLGEPRVGWHRSRIHPRHVLEAAPRVALDPRYRLDGYQWYRDGDGRGAVFAVPVEAPVVLPRTAEDGTLQRPPDALPDLAPALRFRDDGSGLAHLERSFLLRELRDLGALGHGVRWGHHELVADTAEVGGLRWEAGRPATLEPVVEHGPTSRLSFHTICQLGVVRLVRHTDTQAVHDGSVMSSQEPIARGGFGVVP